MRPNFVKISRLFLGIFFITYGLFALNFSVYIHQPGWVFWVCYWGMILIGFGILIGSGELILSQVNLLALPLLFWNIDFFYHLAAGRPLWGITNYFFDQIILPARLISLEHFFLIPLSLLALYLVKVKSAGAWKFSLGEALVFFVLTRLFTDPAHNVNYAFTSGFIPALDGRWFFLWWFLTGAAAVVFTNWLVCNIRIFKDKK